MDRIRPIRSARGPASPLGMSIHADANQKINIPFSPLGIRQERK
jgi:hypothetical protein